jgi:type I restriction enzyme S subunit
MVDVASGANYPAVSDAKVKKSKIPLPPLKEQKRIAEILDAADRLRSIRRKALAQLDVFLQSTFIDLFGDPVTNPKGWEVVKLPAASVKFVDGPFGSNLKTSHYVEHGIRVIRLQDIGVGQLLNRGLAYISREHYESLPRHHCMPGDILIGTMGEPNLRACIMPQSLPEALNKADCLLMRVNSQVALNQYICGLLNCEATVTGALHLVRGQTRGRISLGRLKGLSIPLPPLDVQGQYAQILGKVEIQKQRMQKQLDELDTLFAALQQRAFSGEL